MCTAELRFPGWKNKRKEILHCQNESCFPSANRMRNWYHSCDIESLHAPPRSVKWDKWAYNFSFHIQNISIFIASHVVPVEIWEHLNCISGYLTPECGEDEKISGCWYWTGNTRANLNQFTFISNGEKFVVFKYTSDVCTQDNQCWYNTWLKYINFEDFWTVNNYYFLNMNMIRLTSKSVLVLELLIVVALYMTSAAIECMQVIPH